MDVTLCLLNYAVLFYGAGFFGFYFQDLGVFFLKWCWLGSLVICYVMVFLRYMVLLCLIFKNQDYLCWFLFLKEQLEFYGFYWVIYVFVDAMLLQ